MIQMKTGPMSWVIITRQQVNQELTPDIHTGLKKVSFGMVVAMVAYIVLVSYSIEKKEE